MVAEQNRSTREFAASIFNAAQPLLEKIRRNHPDSIFRMNDLFQINVFTEQDLSESELDELTDDVLDIQDRQRIMFHILPSDRLDMDELHGVKIRMNPQK